MATAALCTRPRGAAGCCGNADARRCAGHRDHADRDVASAAAAALAVSAGANIVRTHNVPFTRDAVAVASAVRRAASPSYSSATAPHLQPVDAQQAVGGH